MAVVTVSEDIIFNSCGECPYCTSVMSSNDDGFGGGPLYNNRTCEKGHFTDRFVGTLSSSIPIYCEFADSSFNGDYDLRKLVATYTNEEILELAQHLRSQSAENDELAEQLKSQLPTDLDSIVEAEDYEKYFDIVKKHLQERGYEIDEDVLKCQKV